METRIIFLLAFIGILTLRSYSQEGTSGNGSIVNDESKQQEIKTLFGGKNGKTSHGGWGGFTLGYTKAGGNDAFLSGGRGGWLIDHHFTLGLAGYGFYSDTDFGDPYQQPTIDNYSLGGGYGGLLIEPVFFPFKPVHISVPIVIGGGGAFIFDEMSYQGYDNYGPYGSYFVLESGVDIEFNIVKFFRLALNISYRYTSDLSLDYYSYPGGIKEFSVPPDALRGFNAGITFKFGKF